jgi:hypothetical protein
VTFKGSIFPVTVSLFEDGSAFTVSTPKKTPKTKPIKETAKTQLQDLHSKKGNRNLILRRRKTE